MIQPPSAQTPPDSILWARRDFLSRHLCRWVGEASRQAEEKHLPPLYRTLLALLTAVVAEDLDFTTAARESLALEGT